MVNLSVHQQVMSFHGLLNQSPAAEVKFCLLLKVWDQSWEALFNPAVGGLAIGK